MNRAIHSCYFTLLLKLKLARQVAYFQIQIIQIAESPNHISSYLPYIISLGMITPPAISRKPLPPLEQTGPLKTVYKWKSMDFAYESDAEREVAIKLKEFVPENNLPLGVEVYGDRIFVSFPKWKQGVPVTLGVVPKVATEPSPKIVPYPSWEWQRTGTVFRQKQEF